MANLDALLPTITPSKVNAAAIGGRPKVLVIDIETAPHEAWVYNTYDVRFISPDQIKKPARMLSFAAKWTDSKKIEFYSEFHNGRTEMLDALWHLLDQAAVVVTYNGNRFDLRWIAGEFLREGYTPPSPYKSVDLYRTIRSTYGFTHNRLDTVCRTLGLGGKVEHGGFTMWRQILEDNDEKAWNLCRKYNRMDVLLTQALLDRLGPYVKGWPHMGLWNGEDRCCYRCGGTALQQHGWHETAITRYARYQCQDCGAWNRATFIRTRTATRPIS